jgi:hypothetical protein
MENQEYEDMGYQDFFNNGYTLAKHDPTLLNEILFELENSGDSRREALVWGKWQFEQEMSKEHVNEFDRIRQKSKQKEKDKDFDRM